jgi:hypothetical protein
MKARFTSKIRAAWSAPAPPFNRSHAVRLFDRETVRGTPIRVHFFRQVGRQRGSHRGNTRGLVHAVASDGREAVCSDGAASSTMFSADKIRATISRGSGAIEAMMGASSFRFLKERNTGGQ